MGVRSHWTRPSSAVRQNAHVFAMRRLRLRVSWMGTRTIETETEEQPRSLGCVRQAAAGRTRQRTDSWGRCNGPRHVRPRTSENAAERVARPAVRRLDLPNLLGNVVMAGRSASKKVRYAVVGLGHIAQVAALPAFKHARRNSTLAALIGDDPEEARRALRQVRRWRDWRASSFPPVHSGGTRARAIRRRRHAGCSHRSGLVRVSRNEIAGRYSSVRAHSAPGPARSVSRSEELEGPSGQIGRAALFSSADHQPAASGIWLSSTIAQA